ncbi:MAG: lipopolysaccharide biosynthesis protein [Gammaproteobacteria bacterium]|nr:lipopolysaccharide biosynthesis protein [Gammaproteobacteria bacterium]
MEQDVKTLHDYLAALRRRRGQMTWVGLVVLTLSLAVAFGLPPVYRATGTILIEQQEIPQDLVRSTVTTYASQRIQVIGQRVMTSTNLLGIIEKYNLYPEERQRDPAEVVVEQMREDIAVEMVSADVVDPKTGKPTQTSIAFKLSYDNRSPDLAQRVANELVSLYLNENVKARTQQAAEAKTFLGDESKRLSEEIAEHERKLAAFKQQHAGQLPELNQLNLQMMDRTERELIEVDRQISALEERKILLQAQLAQVNPTDRLMAETGERILTPADRLKVLQSQYASLSGIYGPDHPDVVKTRKEMRALEQQVGGTDTTADVQRRLDAARAELAATTERYAREHPDVKKAQRTVASLEKELAAAVARRPAAKVVATPDNPAYIQLKAQLTAAETDLKSQREKRAELKEKLKDYENRLTQAPQVEREYKSLMRDYENTVSKYQEIKAKQMQAQLAESLETERKGERFTLIEPPLLPEEPVKPNRLAIAFLGLVFSFAGGIGSAAVAESLDTTVRGRKGVADLLGAPPLANIPVIETLEDRRRRARRRTLLALLAAAVIVGAALLVHLVVMPLDVAWYVALRRLGL